MIDIIVIIINISPTPDVIATLCSGAVCSVSSTYLNPMDIRSCVHVTLDIRLR